VYIAGSADSWLVPPVLQLTLFRGTAVRSLVEAARIGKVRIAPDGGSVAYESVAGGREVLLQDLKYGSAARRLTFSGGHEPVWSRDGSRVAFARGPGGLGRTLSWQRSDGTEADRELAALPQDAPSRLLALSPDDTVALIDRMANFDAELMTLSVADGTLTPFGGVVRRGGSPPGRTTGATFSPDGRWVAYTARETPGVTDHVFVQPYPATGAKYQISGSRGGEAPAWSHNGTRLVYVVPGATELTVVEVSTTAGFSVRPASAIALGVPLVNPTTGERLYDVARDGSFIVGLVSPPGTGPAEQPGAQLPQINVVLNWLEDLKARMGVSGQRTSAGG
jgi:hypothetical protein